MNIETPGSLMEDDIPDSAIALPELTKSFTNSKIFKAIGSLSFSRNDDMSPRAAEEQMEQLMKEMSTWQSRKRKAMILVRELYEEFLAYRTVKVVKLNDWRLGLLKRCFTTGAALYIFVWVISFHQYLKVETPVVLMSPVLVPPRASPGSSARSYCENPPEYIKFLDSPDDQYADNKCTEVPFIAEFAEQQPNGVSVVTYQRTRYLKRQGCRAAYSKAGRSPTYNCTNQQIGAEVGLFVRDAEQVNLVISSSYITSWGESRNDDFDILIQSAACLNTNVFSFFGTGEETSQRSICKSTRFRRGQAISLSVADLLDLVGLDLEAEHEDSGGLGIGDVNDAWPTYRMTGVHLLVSFKFTNFKAYELFTNKAELIVTVTMMSEGAWRSVNSKVLYSGAQQWRSRASNSTAAPSLFSVRRAFGIQVELTSTGVVGTPDWFAAIQAIVGSLFVYALAMSGIEVAAGTMIQGFQYSKYEDDVELRVKSTLRRMLNDVVGQRAESRAATLHQGGGRGAAHSSLPASRDKSDNNIDKFAAPFIYDVQIDGVPYHGVMLRAFGRPNKKCFSARYQWQAQGLTSDMERVWQDIVGANKPEFFASAKYTGKRLRLEITPIGLFGETTNRKTYCRTPMLCMAPFIEEQLTSLLSLERAVFEIIVKPFGKIEVKAMLVLYRASHMTIQPCDECSLNLFLKFHDESSVVNVAGDEHGNKVTSFEASLRDDVYEAPKLALVHLDDFEGLTLRLETKTDNLIAHLNVGPVEQRELIYLLLKRWCSGVTWT